jgi:hypothetical protein
MTSLRNLLILTVLVVAACGEAAGPATTIPPVTTNPVGDEVIGDDGIVWRVVTPTGAAVNPQPISEAEILWIEEDVVALGIYMGVEPCSVIDSVEIDETADSVDIQIFAGTGDPAATCIAIAEARAVVVVLDAPLGDRALTLSGAPLA